MTRIIKKRGNKRKKRRKRGRRKKEKKREKKTQSSPTWKIKSGNGECPVSK